MASTAWLATQLDARMLDKSIASAGTAVSALPLRTGAEVARELNNRPLLRYVDYEAVHEEWRDTATFVSPTPYDPEDQAAFLALPRPDLLREFVIVLDPSKIDVIAGPWWCDLGQGIEFILPDGYGPEAIMDPGWAVKIR